MTKPTAIHEATGAYKKNPNRKRTNEAQPKAGIGEFPKSRPVDPEVIWDEIVNIVVPGVLGDCDRVYLEVVCELVAQFRKEPESFSSSKISQLSAMLGKLGMNPIDRIKVKAPTPDDKEKPEDEFF